LEWMKSQPGKRVVYFPYTPGVSTTTIKKIIIDSANQIVDAALQRESALDFCWAEDERKLVIE